MNVERLHAIANALREDLQSTGAQSLLTSLAGALENLAGQPGQAQYQETVTNSRRELETALERSSVNAWPASWQQTLDEIGLGSMFGSALLERIEGVLARNEITPQTAATEIRSISNEVNSASEHLDALANSFEALNLGEEALEPGQSEVMVLIPRGAVDENLPALGREFSYLNRVFGPFAEIETGSRPPYRVRAIASSDFAVFLLTSASVGAAIAKAIDWVLASYLKILQIRQSRAQLAEQGVPQKVLDEIDEHATGRMQEAIDEYADTYIADANLEAPAGRSHELKIELRLSLNAIANRIDEGYNFDVRVEPLNESQEDDEEDKHNDTANRAVETILDVSPRLKYVNRTGARILSLPEGSTSEES